MDEQAHSYELPVEAPLLPCDDLDARRAQQQRLLAYVKELEAESGPVDPQQLAELRAKAATWPT